MNHGTLLVTLLVLLSVAAGGVFLLVNQGNDVPTLQEESLVGGIGLIGEEFIEENQQSQPDETSTGTVPVDVPIIVPVGTSVETKPDDETSSIQPAEHQVQPSNEDKIEEQFMWCGVDSSASPRQDKITFNEIAWMGTADSAQNEWIELKNISDSEVNLEGWQLFDKKKDVAIALAKEHSISPQSFFILERTDDTTLQNITADVIYTGSLNNIDEALYLFDGACVLQDSVLAKPEWPAGDSTERKSMERAQDLTWYTYEGDVFGTPRKENSTPTSSEGISAEPEEDVVSQPPPLDPEQQEQIEPVQEETYLPILISELRAWGESSKDEFVELYNPTSVFVNLEGWGLKKKTSNGSESNLVSSVKFSGTIAAFGYFLIAPQINEDGTPNYIGLGSPDLRYSGRTYSFAANTFDAH